MTTIIKSGGRRCDAVCHNAKGDNCNCICGGKNHGKTWGHSNTLQEPEHEWGFGMKGLIEGKAGSRTVTFDGEYLNPSPSQKIWNHSPDGFNWGYGGSGPAQLALAIMLKMTSRDQAVRLYQRFKASFIAALPIDKDFSMSIENIREWIDNQIEAKEVE